MRNRIKWQKIVLALIVVVLIVIAGVYFVKKQNSKKATAQTIETPKNNNISYSGTDGKNALEILKEKHQVSSSSSDFGAFVTAIDGTTNTSDTFWMFYINGKSASVASDKYVTKAGDQIEWKYEKSL